MSISALGASQYLPGLTNAPISTTASPATSGTQSTGSVQTGTAAVAARSGGQSGNALLKALQQTLTQYGLNATKTASTTSGAAAGSATTAAAQASVTNLDTSQAQQTFLGALFQTLAQAPTQGTATTATNGAAATTAAASAAAGTAATTTTGLTTNAGNNAGSNTSAGTGGENGAALYASTAQQTSPYNDTGANLSSLLQQLQSGSSNTDSIGNSSTGTTQTGSLAALQTDFQNLLNTASPTSSQAAANAAAPTLQAFLQSLAQNYATDTNAPSTKINAIGSLVETSA